MFRVYVTRRIPEAGLKLLRTECEVEVNPHDRPLSARELSQKIKGRDGLLCLLTDKIDGKLLDEEPKLRGVANYAVGFDNLNRAEATERGIPLSNTPGVLTDATADMAWTLLFATARRVVEADACIRSGSWEGWGPLQFLGGDITGATLGVIGSGRIGTAVALKSLGFAMKVMYANTMRSAVLEDPPLRAERVSIDTLLQTSDYVSVHVPLNADTRHLIDADALRKMKKTAVLVNTSRGPVVDEQALVEALRNGEIAGAGLDVYEYEPKVLEGLKTLPNTTLTPHIASATIGTRDAMAEMAARNLLAMMRGEQPPQCLNPEVYEKN